MGRKGPHHALEEEQVPVPGQHVVPVKPGSGTSPAREAQQEVAMGWGHVGSHRVWGMRAVGGEGAADHFSAVTVHGPTGLP